MSSPSVARAKTSPSPASAQDSRGSAAASSMRQLELFANFAPPTASPTLPSGKTSQEPSPATVAETLLLSSKRWLTSGRVTLRGESWTAASSESPSVAVECSLSRILEANAPSKYWLSPKACAGILRRADKRGKDLPPALATALQQVAQSPANKTTANENYNLVATHVPEKSACLETTNHDYSRADGFTAISYGFYANEGSHGMGDNREVSPAIKIGSGLGIPSPPAVALEVAGTLGGGSGQRGWSNDLDRNGAFIPESTSVVRRLTPVECCRLQGFPDDWNSEGIDAKGKRFSMADAPRYRQLGNAVTVNVANWIANNLVKAYEVAE